VALLPIGPGLTLDDTRHVIIADVGEYLARTAIPDSPGNRDAVEAQLRTSAHARFPGLPVELRRPT